jgi:hypothetical protein
VGQQPGATLSTHWPAGVEPLTHTPHLHARFRAFSQQLAALPRRARRWLARKAALPLTAAALLLALSDVPLAQAATILVTTPDPQIVADGQCSLIEAMDNANWGAIHTDCPTGSGPGGNDTIVLPANSTITLTAGHGTFLGPVGLPTVLRQLTIEGHGATIQRAPGSPPFGILATLEFSTLTLKQLTISGGNANFLGGGILSLGELTLIDSTVSSNGASERGGGIFASRATLHNSTVSDNSAGTGGGIFASRATLHNSTVSGNSADTNGGGMVTSSSLTLFNSTVSDNSAGSSGGGIFNGEQSGTLSLSHSTISGNSAGSSGGGISTHGHEVHPGFYGGPTTHLHRTIVSGNIAPSFREIHNEPLTCGGYFYGPYFYGTCTGSHVIAGDFNVFGHAGETTAAALPHVALGPSDIVATSDGTIPTPLSSILDPLLADNGGPTWTHALVPGSPAVDAIPVADCTLPIDQRGVIRPQGSACDIGAFELEPEVVSTADLLAFFDQAVAEGTLQGVGSGKVASLRLRAVRLTLVLADELVERHQVRLACAELLLVLRLTDGQPQPRDLVTGEAVPELARLIMDVRTALGCE